MRHIDEGFEFFFCDFDLSMEVYLPTEYPSKDLHKYLNQPRHWETYPYEDLVDWCDLERDTIRKTNSDNLGRYLSKEKYHEKGKYIDDGCCEMFVDSKGIDNLDCEIFFCDKGWCTGYEKCPNEIRDKKTFIFLFESGKSLGTKTLLTDISFELVLPYRHEWDLGPSKKGKGENKKKKDKERK